MQMKRKKSVASMPTFSTNCDSFVERIGPIQARGPLPIGGGACLASACLERGAYTTVFRGRRKQNAAATRRVAPIDVPKEARKAVVEIWRPTVSA